VIYVAFVTYQSCQGLVQTQVSVKSRVYGNEVAEFLGLLTMAKLRITSPFGISRICMPKP